MSLVLPKQGATGIRSLVRDIPIRFLLVAGFLLAGLLPVIVTALLTLDSGKEALRLRAMLQLESVLSLKQAQLERYFEAAANDAQTLASDPYVREAAMAMCGSFREQGGAPSGAFQGLNQRRFAAPAPYVQIHDKYEPFLRQYIDKHGYYDLFLMDEQGDEICFTVEKESDFGVRVSQWPTSLREVSQAVRQGAEVALSDTKLYAPSANAAAQFVSAPIRDEHQRVVGILALQVGLGGINRILQERAGMGETGETYLVGPDHKVRSDVWLDPESRSVALSLAGSVEENGILSDAVAEALAGRRGAVRAANYRGRLALTVYAPLRVQETTWALIAEMEDQEIEEQIGDALDRQVLLVLGLSMVAVVALGLLVSMLIGRAVRHLTAAVEDLGSRVQEGELTLQGSPEDMSTDFRGVVRQLNGLLGSFVSLLDLLPAPLALVDRTCHIRFANRAFCTLVGHSREALLGREYQKVCGDAGLQLPVASDGAEEAVDTPVCRAMKSKCTTRAETLWKSGAAESHFLSTAAPVMLADGGVVGAIEVLVDQTEVWQTAKEKEALEEQVSRLHNLDSLGTLAGGIAHDFNNILTYLFAYCDIARGMLPDESPAQAPLGNLGEGIERASELVQRILAFSRQAHSPAWEVDVSKVVHDTLEVARPVLPQNVSMVEELADGMVVKADPSQLQQVVLNLFTNAWQAMPEGGDLRVAVERVGSLSPVPSPGSTPVCPGPTWVCLRVSDTGIGIPGELHQRIFEPFFSGKAPGVGTGLGLSVVHGVVRRLGGRVEVTSAVGKGSTFSVHLPAAEPSRSAPSP